MSKIFGMIIVFSLFLIIACTQTNDTNNIVLSPETQANPLENFTVTETTIPNLCKDIKCKTGEYCQEGKCVCAPDYKDCNGNCISVKNCCSKKDCGSREDCKNNTCIQVELCDHLEKWDNERKRCVCQEGNNYCISQNKCIPVDHCCINDDCNPQGGNDRYCMPTDFKLYLCLKKSGNKACAYSSILKTNNQYTLLNEGFSITINKMFENKQVSINISNSSNAVKIDGFKMGDEIITNFGILNYERLEVSGGHCKSEG